MKGEGRRGPLAENVQRIISEWIRILQHRLSDYVAYLYSLAVAHDADCEKAPDKHTLPHKSSPAYNTEFSSAAASTRTPWNVELRASIQAKSQATAATICYVPPTDLRSVSIYFE